MNNALDCLGGDGPETPPPPPSPLGYGPALLSIKVYVWQERRPIPTKTSDAFGKTKLPEHAVSSSRKYHERRSLLRTHTHGSHGTCAGQACTCTCRSITIAVYRVMLVYWSASIELAAFYPAMLERGIDNLQDGLNSNYGTHVQDTRLERDLRPTQARRGGGGSFPGPRDVWGPAIAQK